MPNRVRRSALSGWSCARGTTRAGSPARITSPVVPMPPGKITRLRGRRGERGVIEGSNSIGREEGLARESPRIRTERLFSRLAASALCSKNTLRSRLPMIPA